MTLSKIETTFQVKEVHICQVHCEPFSNRCMLRSIQMGVYLEGFVRRLALPTSTLSETIFIFKKIYVQLLRELIMHLIFVIDFFSHATIKREKNEF